MRDALHNGWDKNDPKDAQVVLHMLASGQVQRYYDSLAQGIADCQELSKTHEAISKNKTEVLHCLRTYYLPLYFPEVDRFRNNSRSEWFFRFLHEFPTPGTITALSKEAFIAASWDLIGRKVSKKRLERTYSAPTRQSDGNCHLLKTFAAAVASISDRFSTACWVIRHRPRIMTWVLHSAATFYLDQICDRTLLKFPPRKP